MREHATSVHLMLDPDMHDPDDPRRLEVEARQHPEPELADTFYLTVAAGAAASASAARRSCCWPWSSACGPSFTPPWPPPAALTFPLRP